MQCETKLHDALVFVWNNQLKFQLRFLFEERVLVLYMHVSEYLLHVHVRYVAIWLNLASFF